LGNHLGPIESFRGTTILPVRRGVSVALCDDGQVKTDHILFIASGAFHFAKASDLLPELQGRFPIRVELDSLSMRPMSMRDSASSPGTRIWRAMFSELALLVPSQGILCTGSRSPAAAQGEGAPRTSSARPRSGLRKV